MLVFLPVMSLAGKFPVDRWNFNSQAILKDLPEEEYNMLMAHAREERYTKGQVIFREGAAPAGIFYISRGRVKKFKVDNFGNEQIIYVANVGELIGYHAVLAFENYPDSAAALEECRLQFIPLADFLHVLNHSHDLTWRLLKTLSHEYGVLANNISVFGQRPVRERVAITLIVLREKFKNEAPGGEPVINISRDDIASMAGTTPEHVVRLLREFKDEGIIESKGRKIFVTNIEKLVAATHYE